MKLTPMLEQYFEIKRQVPDAILLYRLGDFYEMFFEDAEKAAPILDLVLTARGKGGESEAPMCGVPYHAAEQHIAKLIRHGLSVAICDQMEDPAAAKGIVRREIRRIITPGTAIDGSIVERDSCYLLALSSDEKETGAAYLDVSTGDFFVTTYDGVDDPRMRDDIARLSPREAIFPRESLNGVAGELRDAGVVTTPADDAFFETAAATKFLSRHFGTDSLRGFGLEEGDARIGAAGGALRYAMASHKRELKHVASLRIDHDRDYLLLDASTLQNLEVFAARDSNQARATLWGVLNLTKTAMGSRMLRRWIARPLQGRDAIFDRHDAVDELTRNRPALDRLVAILAAIADLERFVSRVTVGTATPRECIALADSLRAASEAKHALGEFHGPLMSSFAQRIDTLRDVVSRIESTIDRNAPQLLRDGGVIREGVDSKLDALRTIARDSKSILMKIESDERARTGISSLKVRYNSVFGYYIEVSKANLPKVPQEYIRKQTLVNAERFITPELKDLEEKILGAEEKSLAIEQRLYEELLHDVADRAPRIQSTANAVAECDCIAALANVAIRNRYVRPALSEELEIAIEDGRHPVIETLSSERFIPNNTSISPAKNGIQIITGPNMGGKSTYLRQVALIVLLNQLGSFVPAASARLGIFDRIFTRVGASDNLARGESTFMVEMHETANILNNATGSSLVILDEVGRGTATFDGLSLAWAIVEYLHDTESRSPITLFATHYHELTDLAKTKARVANFNVAVKEWNDQIVFLRKVVPGAADKSYGIHVAKLAGIPETVISRSREILQTLERKERDVVAATSHLPAPERGSAVGQLSLFAGDSRGAEIAREIAEMPVETMTPIEALNKLHELKKKLAE